MANWVDLTALAGSSSLVQYSAVALTTSDTVAATTAVAQAGAIGIMQNKPTSTSHAASYRVFGESLVRPTSDAVEAGNLLTPAASGLVQAATASSAQNCIGFAIGSVAASTARGTNDVIKAFINPMGEV